MLICGSLAASTQWLTIEPMYLDLVNCYIMRRLLEQAIACDVGKVCDTCVS